MPAIVHEPAAQHDGNAHEPLEHDERRHLVHFYESDEGLCDVIATFVADGLAAGEALVLLTSDDRRARVMGRLAAKGVDAARAHIVWLNAEESLAAFMSDSAPHPKRFTQIVGGVIARAAEGVTGVRAYGDMVEVLWARGNLDAALRLEELWSDLQEQQPFTLLCAYAISYFAKRPAELEQVCARHDRMHPRTPGAAGDAERTQRSSVERALRSALQDLRKSEEGLTASRRQLRTIIDALPALVAYVDADRRYRFCNRAYEQWFGRPGTEIEGNHLRDVLGDAAYQGVRTHIDRVLDGEPVSFEMQVPYRDAGTRFVEARYVPDLGPDASVQGFVALVSDISARKRLESAREVVTRRTERLGAITTAIAKAVTPTQVFAAIVDEIAETLAASSAALWILRDEGRRAALARSVGWSEQTHAALSDLAVDGPTNAPVLEAIRERKAIWIDSQRELLHRYPELAAMVTPGRDCRVVVLPIMVQGTMLGALGLTFDDAPPLDDELRGLLAVTTRTSGQALERLRLLEAEAESRARSEALAERMALLSAASRAFSEAGHDTTTVLQRVVEQVTETYADACGITLVAESTDALQLAALHHRDPEIDAGLRRLLGSIPPTLDSGLTGRVASTGEPVLIPVLEHESLDTSLSTLEHRAFAERLLPLSIAVVPLRVRGVIIGTLGALRNGRSQPFTHEDVTLLQELADRAALAIDDARLYRDNERARLRAELLYGLTNAVIGAACREDVFEAALEAITRGLDTTRAAILVNHAQTMRFVAWRELSDDYRTAVEGHNPWSSSDRAPQPVLVSNVNEDQSLTGFQALFEREQIASLGFFPLMSADRLLGKFMIYYDEPRTLASHEVELAQAIANHVAAAIARFSAIEDLEQAVRFNEMFTGVLGHDLRTPLGAITTAAQVAMIRNENEKLVKPLSRISNSGQRMARMIEQLLDFTRLRVGSGIPLSPEPLDLVSLVRQTMEEFDDVHHDWTLRLSQAGDTMGSWDADRLSQVFSNLLANAIQHGSVEHGVTVFVDGQDRDRVRAKISNMGEVPAQLLPRLFEPLAGGRRRRDGSHGLGLGLYITRAIVMAHGGSVQVRSDTASGTTMTVSLPRHA